MENRFYCTDKIADHLLPVCKSSSSIRETVNYITLHENLIDKDKDITVSIYMRYVRS